MQIPRDMLALCGDASRGAIAHVYADVEARQAVATNGHILAAVPIDPMDGEVSGYIPREAIEFTWKQKGPLKGLLWHGAECTRVGAASFPNPYAPGDAPEFPAWRQLFPATTPPAVVSLDASYLHALAKVLDPKKTTVTLHLDVADPRLLPVLVTAEGTSATALLMPCRMRENAPAAPTTPTETALETLRATVAEQRAACAALQSQLEAMTAALATAEEELACYRQCYGDVFALVRAPEE